jgi:hypothetical protein
MIFLSGLLSSVGAEGLGIGITVRGDTGRYKRREVYYGKCRAGKARYISGIVPRGTLIGFLGVVTAVNAELIDAALRETEMLATSLPSAIGAY